MNRSKKRAALIVLAAGLPLTAGLVLAQQTAPQRVQPAQPGQQSQTAPGTQNGQTRPRTSGTNSAEVFLQKLATGLGISVERLRAAAVAAGGATIDQRVRAGDIPQDRAAGMKGRLQQNPFAFGGRGGHGLGGHHHGSGDAFGRMDGGPRLDRPENSNGTGTGTTSGT